MTHKLTNRATEYHQRLKTPRGKAFYRCGTCRTRKVLKRELWEYLRPPKCPFCGDLNWWIDLSRTRDHREKKNGYTICDCAGYSFRHHKGGGVWCIHHATGPTDEDYLIRYGK